MHLSEMASLRKADMRKARGKEEDKDSSVVVNKIMCIATNHRGAQKRQVKAGKCLGRSRVAMGAPFLQSSALCRYL